MTRTDELTTLIDASINQIKYCVESVKDYIDHKKSADHYLVLLDNEVKDLDKYISEFHSLKSL